MIGSIRIADVPQLIITLVVFGILSCAFFLLLGQFPSLDEAMPIGVFVGVLLLFIAASIVGGHYIWKWLDDR
jgi:hypothetical protein